MRGTKTIRLDMVSFRSLCESKRRLKAKSYSETIRAWERQLNNKKTEEDDKFDKMFGRI